MPPRTEALCAENISFLERALESCTIDCHPPTKTSFLPTRLLDLGTDPASQPRLIITADSIDIAALNPTEPLRYAALSYCWGNREDAFTQTKTEPWNLHERLRAIPTRDMSAVMQDTIAVCRALSVRYLWIDALCIIQDLVDPSDWQRESGRVGEVYQYAYFTICAVSTSSCHQSFLARSQHTFDFSFQSSLYPPARGRYTLHYTGPCEGLPTYDPLSSDLRDSSWDKRGWVFQERELSARKLMFGQHMVHFRCDQNQMSENGEYDAAEWSIGTLRAKQTREQTYECFRSMASVYASRQLSYESDRLPALAGLVKRMFELVGGGKYLAGLWMEDLHLGLLWTSDQNKQGITERLKSLHASSGSGPPSWSWVSQPAHGYNLPYCDDLWSDRHLRPEYTEIDGCATLKGAGLNPFGEVESGTIRFCSKVLPLPADLVLLRRPDGLYFIRKASRRGAVVAYCYLDWVETSLNLPERLSMLLLSSWCNQKNEEDEKNDGEDSGEDEDVAEKEDEGDVGQGRSLEGEMDSANIGSEDGDFCVLCNNEAHNRHARGLILYPAERIGKYYRVGVFVSRAGKAGGTQLFKDLENQCISII
jgi:hypothetical protein